MTNIGTIKGTIELEDKFTDALQLVETRLGAASTKFDKMGTDLTKVGTTLSAAVTLPLAGMAYQAITTGAEFERAMNSIDGVLRPAAQMEKVRAIAIKMGADTAFSATDAATAMLELGKAGFTTEEAMAGVDDVMDLAAASGLSMGESAEMAARTMNAFGLEVGDLAHINDVLAAAVNKSSLNIDDLRLGFQYFGPIAKGFGVSIEQASAALAIMRDNGIAAETAGRALREGFSRMANPVKNVEEVMTELGIKSFMVGGKMREMGDIIQELRDKNITAAQSLKLFGDAAGPGMYALVQKGKGALDELTHTFENSDGAAKRMGATMMQGLPGAIERLKGSVETAWLSISKAIEPVVITAMDLMGGLADIITNYVVPAFQVLPGPVQAAAFAVVAFAALLGPLALAIGGVSTALGVLAGSTAVVGTIKAITAGALAFSNTIPVLTANLWALDKVGMTLTASLGWLALGIGAVWTAWKIGNTESVKNSIASWALSADNLTAKLFRAVAGVDKMTEAEARAAVAATAAAERGDKAAVATTKVAEATGTFADELARATGAQDKAAPALQSMSQQLKATETAVARLTAEQKAQIASGDKLGMSSKEIAEAFNQLWPAVGLTDKAVDLYKKQLDRASTSSKKLEKDQEDLQKAIGANMKIAAEDAARSWETIARAQDEAGLRAIKAVEEQYKKRRQYELDFDREHRESVMSRYDFEVDEIDRWVVAEKAALDRSVEGWQKAEEAIDQLATQRKGTLQKNNKDLQAAMLEFPGLFAEAFGTAGMSVAGAVDKVTNAGDRIRTTLSTLSGAFSDLAEISGTKFGAIAKGVGTVIAAWSTAAEAGDTLGKGIKGLTAEGGDLISSLGDIVAGTVAAIGAMDSATSSSNRLAASWGGLAAGAQVGSTFGPIGTVVGAAVGFFVGFERASKKARAETKALWDEFNRLQFKMGDLAKNGESLDDVLAQVGMTASDFFSDGTVEQRIDHINAALAEFEERAKAVSQRTGEMLEGFNATVKGIMSAGAVTADTLARLSEQAVLSIVGAVAAGKTWAEALSAAAPGLQLLEDAYKRLGLEIDNVALKNLMMHAEFLEKNPDLILGVDGLAMSMTAMNDLGLMNVDMFASMQETGMEMYTRLQAAADAAGTGARGALLPMQDYLHAAEEAAKKLGVPLDENTQMLIDQSKELGLWKDKGQDATSKLLEGMTTLVDKVAELMGYLSNVVGSITGLPAVKDVRINVFENIERTVTEYHRDGGDLEGRAKGSPGTQFENWGRESTVNLHNREAVVTPAQGESLAGMVQDAIAAGHAAGGGVDMGGVISELRSMKNAMTHQNNNLLAGIRDSFAQMAIV